MKTMWAALVLAMGMGLGVAACGAAPTQQGDVEEAQQGEPVGAAEEAACSRGYTWSCYAPNECACCPNGTVYDCVPGWRCYCCSGNTCE